MWTPDPTAGAETSTAAAAAGGLAGEPVASRSGRRSGARPGPVARALRRPLVAVEEGRGREADVDVTTGSTASGARAIPRGLPRTPGYPRHAGQQRAPRREVRKLHGMEGYHPAVEEYLETIL